MSEIVPEEQPAPVAEPVPPTQVRHPWRATIRTAFQSIVALAAALPFLVHEAGLDPEKWPWLATALVVAAAITRVMANRRVELFLRRAFPWLAARPKE